MQQWQWVDSTITRDEKKNIYCNNNNEAKNKNAWRHCSVEAQEAVGPIQRIISSYYVIILIVQGSL